ncbi:MAG: act [Bacillales bacterium]|jgi:ADP-ribose pyrophosphatase|nr:act [Bacillales bacterium]
MSNQHHYYEKTISTEKIFEGRVIKVQVDQVELPNGAIHSREIVKHPGAVGIIAITNEGKLILVDQFRKPCECGLLEIPAGKLEKDEPPNHTAGRELEEETGLKAESLELLYTFYTAPGFSDELFYLYLANGISKIENPASADEDEFVDVIEVTLDEAEQLIVDGKIRDAKTIMAVQFMQLRKM